MTDFFALYDALLPEIPQEPILCVSSGDFWTGVETVNNLGLAMTTAGDTAPRVLPRWEEAATLAELAPAVKSCPRRTTSRARRYTRNCLPFL